MSKTTIEERRAARACANAHVSCPVVVISGPAAPKLVGESYHWETASGTRIDHPNAYAKKGWSNCFYIASSLRVVVGRGWLRAQAEADHTEAVMEGEV